ncbi:MAG: hypothetical protein WBC33_12585, partial [Conexibacter sp.]
MRRTRGLSLRLVVAIGTLAALQLAVFVTMVVAIHGLRAADGDARHAAQTARTALDVQLALAELEAAERGVVIGRSRPAYVAAWRRSVAELHARTNAFAAAAGSQDRQLAADVRAYATEFSTAHAAEAARAHVAPGPGEPHAEALQARLGALVLHERSARQAWR